MNRFNKFWSGISNIGITKNINVSAIKRFKLSNQLTFISVVLTLIFTFLYIYWNIPKAVITELVFTSVYLLVITLAKLGKLNFSKLLFIFSVNMHMFCLALCFGEASQAYLLFIPVSVIPLILFDFSSAKTIVALILFSIAIYVCLFVLNFSSPLAAQIDTNIIFTMRILFNITAIFCEIIIVYTFINSYDRAEKTLDESNILLEQQFESIFDNSYDALFLVDSGAKKIVRANKRAVELFEMENENDFYSFNGTDFHKNPLTKKESDFMLNEVITKGIYNGEVIYKTKKNNEFWGALAIRAMFIGGKRYQSVRVADITVQKEYEKKIRASLNEKEILLSEIHHRVKNNMAVISGLLGLQSSYIEDYKAKELFEESRNRIHSMAMIHDKLYQHETFANIDFSSYINDLVNHIKNSYIAAGVELKFSVICNDVFLDIKNAVPCGLILNELISNSCKHAFKGRNKGEIKIVCTRMGEKFTMMVSDDGVGFDAEVRLGNPDSLGLTLVKALVDQINGTVKTTYHNGTTYYLSFEA